MPDQKTDSQDILAHLRGRNKYVHPNAVANIPSGPLQPLSPLQIQATAHQIAHQINHHHKWPSTIKHILYIIKQKRGNDNLGDRTKICTLECINQPLAIIDAIRNKFRHYYINDDAAKWVFGYVIGKEKISREINSFNCQTDDILWDKFSHFTIREPMLIKDAPNSKSEKNKRDYKLKASQMDEGDAKLRELFDKPTYNQITKNTKLFIKAKYKAGIERISDSDIIDMITDGLDEARDANEKKTNITNNTAGSTGGWESNFNKMMQLCMMQMMNNMTNNSQQTSNNNNANNNGPIAGTIPPPVPALPGLASEPRTVANRAYAPARGTSTNTARSRHTPIAKTDLKCKLPKL